jgi:hypothetical protein
MWGWVFFMGFLLFLSDLMVPLIIFYIELMVLTLTAILLTGGNG